MNTAGLGFLGKKVSKILLARYPLFHLKVVDNIVITGLRIPGEEIFPFLNSG